MGRKTKLRCVLYDEKAYPGHEREKERAAFPTAFIGVLFRDRETRYTRAEIPFLTHKSCAFARTNPTSPAESLVETI